MKKFEFKLTRYEFKLEDNRQALKKLLSNINNKEYIWFLEYDESQNLDSGFLFEDDVEIKNDEFQEKIQTQEYYIIHAIIKLFKNKKELKNNRWMMNLQIYDTIFATLDVIDNELSTTKYIPRETLRKVTTPQAYRFCTLSKAYHKAFEQGIGIKGSSYTNTMMVELGERLYFAAGSEKNIKLTTKEDLETFKAFLVARRDNWLK